VIGAATRVRHSLAQAIHRFFDENGFFWVNTPIITASDAEGPGGIVPGLDPGSGQSAAHTEGAGSTSHKISFAGEAFLTVSGQLNIEAYCLAPTKVHTFGPIFRAENSNTSRQVYLREPNVLHCRRVTGAAFCRWLTPPLSAGLRSRRLWRDRQAWRRTHGRWAVATFSWHATTTTLCSMP